ncbi:MAG: GGDEF domain-containing protein [Hyphomonadaceae bacterium]|nr:GGDEF domain-containing protein [Hyphomonadaceae bacterium]
MALRFGKSATETTEPLLMRWGLKRRDVSDRALDVLRAMDAERAELEERLQIAEGLAVRDPLTATLNRRGFMTELHRAMSEMERYGTPAAVIYVDLDGFKGLNDNYGHATGDAVLKHVGKLLMESVRDSDVVGRLGGDEFGVILTHVGAEEARAKAHALGEAIQSRPIMHAGMAHRVRISIGVHPIAQAEAPETAIERADEAMYAEKFARRAEMKVAF